MICPDCGAAWPDDRTCENAFHQFLYWENENPGVGQKVHALMVLCYHLQHPGILSQAWLDGAGLLLRDLVDGGLEPADLRRRMAQAVDSGRRQWKIKAEPDSHGKYPHAITWNTTAADVLAGGVERYGVSIHAWAAATLADMRDSGNLEINHSRDR